MTLCSSSVPLYDQTNYFAEHICSQPVKGWCTFTLQYPRWSNLKLWEICLRRTFRELENRILKRQTRKQNTETGATSIRRMVTIGGNPEKGIRYHAQGMIDGVVEEKYLTKELAKVWRNNVRRVVQSGGHIFHEKEATVYVRPLDEDIKRHVFYLVRNEDPKVGWGVNKIMGSGLSYLT
jgi:hypothetical protein